MVSPAIYFLESCKLAFEDNEARLQSRKIQLHWDVVCSDPRVSAASVLSNVHSALRGSPVPENGSQNTSNADELESTGVETIGEIPDLEDV